MTSATSGKTEPRPAATVILLRDTAAGPEVFMLQRTRGAAFLPGAYVFPGGAIDASDGDPRAARRVIGLTDAQAKEFYAVHRERPFYNSLVAFMTSGTCMPMVLEKAGAVAALREAIGATDPAEAKPNTVRKLYAESKERNAIHASDSDENAARESRFFFAETDLIAG